MKWPNFLTLLRHGESAFNKLQKERNKHSLWKEFLEAFETDHTSYRTKKLAEEILKLFPLPYNDYDTPLTDKGREQARYTGKFLQTKISLPDAVITSPYTRCRDTFFWMTNTWPELRDVPYFTEELISERDIGEAILYTNWRLFYAFYPEQKKLYDLVGYYHYRFPQGENIPDVRRRTRIWNGTLIREFSEKNVLAITHHLTILSIRANQERMSPELFVSLNEKEPPKNCSVTIYKGHPELGQNGRLVLEAYNMIANEPHT